MIPNGVVASAAPHTTLNFTAGTQNLGSPVGRVHWSGQRFWCGVGSIVYYSYDGLNWTDSSFPGSGWNDAYGVPMFPDGSFVVSTGSTGTTMYLWNETTDAWVTITMPWSATWTSMAYGDGRYLAGHRTSSVDLATSADLVNWTAVAPPVSTGAAGVLFFDGRFFAEHYSTGGAPYWRTDWTNLTAGGWFGAAGSYGFPRPYVSGGWLLASHNTGTIRSNVPGTPSWFSAGAEFYIAKGELILGSLSLVGSATQYRQFDPATFTWSTITASPGGTNQYFCWGNGIVVFSSDAAGTANNYTYIGRPI